jgi:hypothetical protein
MLDSVPSAAVQLLHVHLGSPEHHDCVPAEGRCWLCAGEFSRGQPVEKWNGASFTGQNRVRCPDAVWVCEPCVYFCARLSPVPGRPPAPGKKLGGNYRNYSHLYDDAASPPYLNASKGEKPLMLEFLRRHHRGTWFAAIADSGQKHVLPWTPVNPPDTRRGRVLFDETIVELPAANGAGWTLVNRITGLLTDGATKAEVETGRYTARAWQLLGAARLRGFEERWAEPRRGGGWFALALWLAQRDEDEVKRRLAAEKEAKKRAKAHKRAGRKPANKDGGAAAGAAKSVSRRRRQPAEALGSDPKQDAERRPPERKPGRVGNEDAAGPAAADPRQGWLPGFS